MGQDKQHKRQIILICGAFTSANFYVMLSVIRSLGDVHIHAVSANNEGNLNLPIYEDVTYYHVHNWRLSFLSAVRKMPILFLSKAIEYFFYKVTAVYDNYFTSIYERNIYRKCHQIIKVQEIDAIFSVCLRFYTHRIAWKLSSETSIKWYQFWVDPFSNRKERQNNRIWYNGAKKIECRFLEQASRVYALPEVFVGSEFIAKYKQKLITFEIPYLINRNVKTTTNDVIFAGGFLKRIREPEPVLNILLSIVDDIDKDIRFHFYVRHKEQFAIYTEQSEGKVCFHDYIGHEELYQRLSNSYMLLNIGNAGSIQMPSKTVEYVSFRKPLLFFYKDVNDPSLRYLEDYPVICRVNVDEGTEINKQKLINFFKGKHSEISYEELMKVEVFRKSTPQYMASILSEDQ